MFWHTAYCNTSHIVGVNSTWSAGKLPRYP